MLLTVYKSHEAGTIGKALPVDIVCEAPPQSIIASLTEPWLKVPAYLSGELRGRDTPQQAYLQKFVEFAFNQRFAERILIHLLEEACCEQFRELCTSALILRVQRDFIDLHGRIRLDRGK